MYLYLRVLVERVYLCLVLMCTFVLRTRRIRFDRGPERYELCRVGISTGAMLSKMVFEMLEMPEMLCCTALYLCISVSSFATAKCKNKISESASTRFVEERTTIAVSRDFPPSRERQRKRWSEIYGIVEPEPAETDDLKYCGGQCKYRQ